MDEDIFDLGERKRQLSQAVLSDNLEVKPGESKMKENSEEDINVISQILSKAINRFVDA